eukprot:SAG31_NODE_2910_length_4916_cov_3.526545_2_plen_112_part_00
MILISNACRYELKGNETPEFASFLAHLMDPDAEKRYSARQALSDPWVLGTDWTTEQASSLLNAMDTSGADIPGDYTSRAAWLTQVEALAADGPPTVDISETMRDDEGNNSF